MSDPSNRCGLAIAEYSGCTSGVPNDQIVTSTGTSTQAITGNVTTSESSEAFSYGVTKGFNETPSTENGFSNLLNNTNGRVCYSDRMVTASASTYHGQMGFDASNSWGSVLVTFRSTNAAAGGALLSPSCFLPLIGVQMYDL